MTQSPPADSFAFFESTWRVYRKIVDGNHMHHREIFQAIQATLEHLDQPLSILDLGCGDASMMGSILESLAIRDYHGVDASQPALDLAQEGLATIAAKSRLTCSDMLQFLQETPPEAYDVILMSFSLHHLTTVQKEEFLRLCSARLAKKGRLIVVDIFRRNGQAIEDYLQCYVADMRDHWASLDAADLELATHHVRNFDLPETLDDFLALARKAGLVLESPPLQYGYHALAILSSPP